MKRRPIFSLSADQTDRDHQGVALVLVLSFLVIISGLIIAFFSMVTTEASSAGTTAAAASAKSLSDSAVSYVMGTIVDATMGRDPNDTTGTLGGPKNAWVWTSQPGMIRTFNNQGVPQYVYKLYSADNMKLDTAAPAATDTAGITQWATGGNTAVWVDMNEPVKDALGDDIYPIVDPRAAEDYDPTAYPGYPGHDDVPKDTNGAPINPSATNHRVEGFHIGKNGTQNSADQNAPAYDAHNNNPAPMPVKWLYVLQDGTLTTAERDGNDAILNGNYAKIGNPIKGRIAFWTDDESSKININTASEGTYWDIPRVSSAADAGFISNTNVSNTAAPPPVGIAGLALCQPVKGEYQRFGGHPATTCLSTVFGYKGANGSLTPVLPVPAPTNNRNFNAQEAAQFNQYYNLTPRNLPGGSNSGTVASLTALTGPGITPAQGSYWRLYSSIDELLFSALAPISSDNDRVHRYPSMYSVVNGVKTGAITPDMAQKAKFFITANSSAPEVNAYGTPRISMWPVNDSSHVPPWAGPNGKLLETTPFDDLASFCATIGPPPDKTKPNILSTNVYYFTRWNARSQSADYVGRNQTLYSYLQALTSLPIPGNPGGANSTFANKYQADRDQILTCVYDYIRCTNMQDQTLNAQGLASAQYTPSSTFNGQANTSPDPFPGGGEVVPIRINNTQGFGRFDTIGSAYLLFFPAHGRPYTKVDGSGKPIAPFVPPMVPRPPNVSPNDAGPIDALGVVFMLSFYSPMQGNVGNHPKTQYQIDNLDKLVFTAGPFKPVQQGGAGAYAHTFTGTSGGGTTTQTSVLPNTGINFIETNDVRTWHGRGVGGTSSPSMAFSNGLFDRSNNKLCRVQGGTVPKNYPFYGYTDQIPIPVENQAYDPAKNLYWPTKFSIAHNPASADQEIIVKIMTAPTTPTPKALFGNPTMEGVEIVQTIHLRFPPLGIFQMPSELPEKASADGVYSDFPIGSGVPRYQKFANFIFNNRFPACTGSGTDDFVRTTDTVVALEPAGVTNTGAEVAPTVDHTAGDQRMYAALSNVPSKYFQPDWRYGLGGITTTDFMNVGDGQKPPSQYAHNMMRSISGTVGNEAGLYHGVVTGGALNLGQLVKVSNYSRNPDVPRRVENYVTRAGGGPASWDTGMGMHKDGAYISKPDEGDENYLNRENSPTIYRLPYYDKDDYYNNVGSYFSPNRQIPSPMVLGSIPTGIQRQLPWQTLLFHPPKLSDTAHPGSLSPSDHYLADLFWMPVVEPYAISQPFSTAGKINLNYQIQPFTYIHRNTGMRALMKSMKMMAIPTNVANIYKPPFSGNGGTGVNDCRYPINMDATMTILNKRFDIDHDVYRSATEIATLPLIPNDPQSLPVSPSDDFSSLSTKADSYWGVANGLSSTHQLTGNNLRDKPYADLYGRLTTKSNVFTVHVRAQSLRKATNAGANTDANANRWISAKDQVVAEYRGSSIIERYIDANDPSLPDFATQTIAKPDSPVLNIDQYYKFRVVSTKRFAP